MLGLTYVNGEVIWARTSKCRDKIKDYEMDWACSTHVLDGEVHTTF